jgi:uncharacterized protein YtpQ (UPF0354 family)
MSRMGIWLIRLMGCVAATLAIASIAYASDADDGGLRDKAEFGADFAAAANQRYPAVHARFVSKDFSVVFDGNGHDPYTAFLDNAYLMYRNHPSDEQGVIDHYVSAMVKIFSSKSTVADTDRLALLPVIKDTGWVNGANQMMAHSKRPSRLVMTPLADGLYEVYVIDAQQTMRFVNTAAQAELDMTADQIQDQAARNLALLLPNIQLERDGSIYRIRLDTNYETSLPLVFARWKNRLDFAHDPVFAMPARGELLVADSTDEASVQRLRSMALEDSQRSTYPITAQLYVLHGDGWSVLH